MRHLFAKYGFGTSPPPSDGSETSELLAKIRRSRPLDYGFEGLTVDATMDRGFTSRKHYRSAVQLKKLSCSALPSKAISLIRDGISSLSWAIQPREEILSKEQLSEYEESTSTVRRVLERPNSEDNDFPTFIGQIVEDVLIFDAGCWEYVERPRYLRDNIFLALVPVPGDTVAKNIKWNGNPNNIRWRQTIGKKPKFKDKELEYIMRRKRTFSPFGYSPLETAAEIMDAWLGLSSYQRIVASNAYPPILVYLGESTKKDQAERMRHYWQNELQGRGTPGIWGNTGKPEVLSLKPTGDEGLYLKYQENLVRVLASCFGLKPQDFGIERDVNRSTSQVGQKQSVQEALLPIATLIQSRITTRVIPRIADLARDDRIRHLQFFYLDVDPRDRKTTADIHKIYADTDTLMVDEIRRERNAPPLPHGLGQLTMTGLKELLKRDPMALINGPQDPLPPASSAPLQTGAVE